MSKTNTVRRQGGFLSSYRGRGLGLLALAVLAAIATVALLAAWSNNPQPLLVSEPAGGVPRARTGLVSTSQNAGQVLFGRYCDSCHTGGREFTGPSLRSARFKGQNPTVEKIITLVRKGGFDMPAFPPTLISDEEVQQIAEFVVSLPEDKP